MCYFPVKIMACGHKEVSGIALRCPTEARYGTFYILPEEITANEPHICRQIRKPKGDHSSQKAEARSGEMCAQCQVATSKILDDLVHEVNVPKANDGQQCMMMGGLDADIVDQFPTNALDDLVRDLDEAIASNGQYYRSSGEHYVDIISNYPENASNGFECSDKKDPLNDTTFNTHKMSDKPFRKEFGRTHKDAVTEWLSQSDTFEDATAGDEIGGEILRNLSKSSPNGSTKCSSCKGFKRRGTLVNCHEGAGLSPTFGSPYQARSWPILAMLQSDDTVQEKEGGLLRGFGWVCCEKCGARMHLP